MYPQPFSDLVKQWLVDANHPGVARVQTHAEVGRHEQPCGIKVTLVDGWSVWTQMVGSAPPGGGQGAAPPGSNIPPEGRDDYRQARAIADREALAVAKPARGAKPGMRAGEVLAVLLDVVKRANHPEVVYAEVAPTTAYTVNKDYLRVTFTDGSKVTGMVCGVMPPGSTDFAHPAHEIPKEYA